MQKVEYKTTVEIPLDVLWDFIKDFNNWGPLVKGYQSHEIVNDKESIWLVKAEFGCFSRRTRFHTTITEWAEKERVAFEMTGLNEPVTGYGIVHLAQQGSGGLTSISAELGCNAGGPMGPVLNRMAEPWINTVAEELVVKLVDKVSGNGKFSEDTKMPPVSSGQTVFARLYMAVIKIWRRLLSKSGRNLDFPVR